MRIFSFVDRLKIIRKILWFLIRGMVLLNENFKNTLQKNPSIENRNRPPDSTLE